MASAAIDVTPAPGAPDWLRGCWERPLLRTPDGDDATTCVRYVQSPLAYADVRIPADRPDVAGRPLEALDDDTLAALARQQGFAGTVTCAGDVVTWTRTIDYQPPGPVPDVGRIERIGACTLVEHGVHAEYLERWVRLPDDDGPTLALVADDAPRAVLVVAGDHFGFARDRALPLPAGVPSLAAALAQGGRAERLAWLDCECAWGRVAGAATPWIVGRSTLPAREGTPVVVPGSLRAVGGDAFDERLPGGGWRRWRLVDGDPAGLALLLRP